jgi:hypothetical protein
LAWFSITGYKGRIKLIKKQAAGNIFLAFAYFEIYLSLDLSRFLQQLWRSRRKTIIFKIMCKLNKNILKLMQDTYKLEITTQFSMGKHLLKKPQTAIFNKILKVK